jgi:hypothetical protein
MTVTVTKPQATLRELLAGLKKKTGLFGEQVIRAETAADFYSVIGNNRNIVINGAMNIAQRSTSVTLGGGQSGHFTVDRFGHQNGGFNGNVIYSQVADGPPGFDYSAKMTVNTAHSGGFSPTTYAGWYYGAEGYDCQRLGWGANNPKPLTISFWVKSSIAGNYPHVGIRYDSTSGTASSFFNFAINSANIWEYKTVTIPASPYSITQKTNGGGIQLHINTLAGVGGAGTPSQGPWVLANCLGTNAQVNNGIWITTANATFQITGVQMEVGSVATPFEYKTYQEELALCQRYYEEYIFPGTNGYNDIVFQATAGNFCRGSIPYKVTKRAAPSIALVGTLVAYNSTDNVATPVSLNLTLGSTTNASIRLLLDSSNLVAGNASCLAAYPSAAKFTFNSEI